MCLSEVGSTKGDNCVNLLYSSMAPDHQQVRVADSEVQAAGSSEIQDGRAAGEGDHLEVVPVAVDAKLNEILTSLSSLKQELNSLTRSPTNPKP